MVAGPDGLHTVAEDSDADGVEPLACWYLCDGLADPDCTAGLHKGYGYCVQVGPRPLGRAPPPHGGVLVPPS